MYCKKCKYKKQASFDYPCNECKAIAPDNAPSYYKNHYKKEDKT